MKKTLMIALAGMMLFAFTQCGNDSKDSKKDGESTETQVSGSKEYQNYVKYIDEATKVLKNAKDCDKYEKDLVQLEKKYDKEFDKKDQMTKDEESKAEEMLRGFEELSIKTRERLECY